MAAAPSARPCLLAAGPAANPDPFRSSSSSHPPILQGNLLAQCSTALLVAAAASWIRISEARYRQVVTHIPVVLYSARVVGPPPGGAGRRRRGDAGQRRQRGRCSAARPTDLLGDYERWLERVHPDDREVLLAALAQLGRQRQPVTCEYRLAARRPDSRRGRELTAGTPRPTAAADRAPRPPRPCRAAGCATRWRRTSTPTAELAGWEGVVSDITEQRALADDLRRTTSMFHALVANLPAGVFFVQGRGRPAAPGQRPRPPAAGPARGRLRRAGAPRRGLPPVPPRRHALPDRRAAGRRRPCAAARPPCATTSWSTAPTAGALPLVTWAAPVDLGGAGRAGRGGLGAGGPDGAAPGRGGPPRQRGAGCGRSSRRWPRGWSCRTASGRGRRRATPRPARCSAETPERLRGRHADRLRPGARERGRRAAAAEEHPAHAVLRDGPPGA